MLRNPIGVGNQLSINTLDAVRDSLNIV